MSENFSDKYMKGFRENAKFIQANCSGSYLELGHFDPYQSGISWDNHKYVERVMCNYCESTYYVGKENTRCPSCGASH